MMHLRNIYRNNPADFGEIGEHYAAFRKHLIPTKSGGYTINFKDPSALRELTVCLLDQDFGLKVDLPLNRLIPTVPQKLNYIHWVEDLLHKLSDISKCETVKGIDIGTGASCIYPLLGAKMNGWKFCASEVDSVSFGFACENVKRNNLEKNIQVHLVSSETFIKPLLKTDEKYDFCMCNPPFFSDEAEATGNLSRTGSRPTPSSVCTGSVTETVTAGGEVEFVGRIIEDSLELKSRVKWYTTMLGKKSSVTTVVSKLKNNNIQNIVTTEFCQGRTMRWGVAWTFLSNVITEAMTLKDLLDSFFSNSANLMAAFKIQTSQGPPKKKRKSKPLMFNFSSEKLYDKSGTPSELIKEDLLVSRFADITKNILLGFQVNILSEHVQNTLETIKTRFHCTAKYNTWANQRRRRREEARRLGNEALNQTKNSLTNLLRHEDKISEENEKTEKIPKVVSQATKEFEKTKKDHTMTVNNSDELEKIPTNGENGDESPELRPTPDDEYFIEFCLEVGVKLREVIPGNFPKVFLEMEWIKGQDHNSMYQLFQYFQNHLPHKYSELS